MRMTERAAFSSKWPLREFWKDRVKPHREVTDAYMEPILNAALEEKKIGEQNGNSSEEQATFLRHLVEATDGMSRPISR